MAHRHFGTANTLIFVPAERNFFFDEHFRVKLYVHDGGKWSRKGIQAVDWLASRIAFVRPVPGILRLSRPR